MPRIPSLRKSRLRVVLNGSVGTGIFAAMAGLTGSVQAQMPTPPTYTPDLLPTYSEAGKCYMRVEIPAQYTSRLQTVVKRSAHTQVSVQPAKLATRTEDILVREAHERYEVRQPTFKTVTETVMTRPAHDTLSVIPARFRKVTETIQTSSPRLVWKKGNPGELRRQGYKIHSMADAGRFGQGYSSTTQFGMQGGEKCGPMCEIWCLVEAPGESVTISREVMSEPGQVRRTHVPARYESIAKQVMTDPGGVRKIQVPAQFKTVQIQDLIEPAREIHVNVPDAYGQVKTREMVEGERYEWREVRCAPGTGTIGYKPPHAVSTPSSYTGSVRSTRHIVSTPAPARPVRSTGLSAYKDGSVFQESGSAPDHYTGTGQRPVLVIPDQPRTLPEPIRHSDGQRGYPVKKRHTPNRTRD